MLSKDGLWGGPEEVAHSGLIRVLPKHAKDKEEGNEQLFYAGSVVPTKTTKTAA